MKNKKVSFARSLKYDGMRLLQMIQCRIVNIRDKIMQVTGVGFHLICVETALIGRVENTEEHCVHE